jgi:kumamolisin
MSIFYGIALIAGLEPVSPAQAQSTASRITFANSIKEPVIATANASIAKNGPTVVRSQLTDAETQTTIDFSIALKMRNFAELQQRVGSGEIIPLEEMSAKYFPASADIENVRKWLIGEGFDVLPRAQYELGVFAHGTVTQLQRAFGVAFARVQFRGEEHTSAVTAPSLPLAVAEPVLSVNGLQPHLHAFPHSVRKAVEPGKLVHNASPYLVSEIAKAYDASNGNGAGEKIGIVIDTFPLDSDLTAFWSYNSVPQSLSNIEKVQVVSGILGGPSGEETLDTEWSSGIASAAKVRIYATVDLQFSHLDQGYQYIVNELSSQPELHQISLSYGLGEIDMPPGQMDTDDGYLASIAARGVTIFVSSGDGGSTPGTNGYGDTSGPVQVESPASDPNVTAVGGTTMHLNKSTGLVASESTWSLGGGGQSQHFPRPTWQPGSSSISGSKRLVPDVAAVADPNTGGILVLNGLGYEVGGTSWSSPTWAGFCARINQARAGNGAPSLGLLGQRIYPLLLSSNFRDVTTGSNGPNGVYNAGSGFDLCTGIGVPDVNTLIRVLGKPISQGSGVAKDFDGDGSADLIWENTSNGQQLIWRTTNGVLLSSFSLPTTSARVAGVGDFLGNGQSDLVFENIGSGTHAIWILDNGVYYYSIGLPTTSAGWHVVGAGDFNGDGFADVVLENTNTGQHVIWLLKNGLYQSSIALPSFSPTWHIAGVGDFLSNGQTDLVLQNMVTGQCFIWILANGVPQQIILFPTSLSAGWRIAGAADFDGDGSADLVLQNVTTGQHVIWLLNNGVYSSSIGLPAGSTQWTIVDH